MSRPSRFAVAKEHIIQDLEGVIADLLKTGASPRFKRRHAWNVVSPWRAKAKPSQTIIHLTGAKRGGFCDYAGGVSGDAIDLVAWANEGDVNADSRMRAVAWAEDRYNIRQMHPKARARMQAEAGARQKALAAREAERIKTARDRARKFFFSCEPEILGTPVETYLASRGIALVDVPNMAPAIRYCPACEWWLGAEHDANGRRVVPGPTFPAMISAMVDKVGRLAACHYTFLQADGSGKAPLDRAKLMFPDTRGLMIRLTYGPSNLNMEKAAAAGTTGPAGLTEGIEDALSAGMVDPDLRMSAAGSLPNMLSVADHDAVSGWIVFKDNDWDKPAAIEQFNRAFAHISSFGKPVEQISMPASMGKDVNDAINTE